MGLQSQIKPKRSLGQNFFNNKSLAEHIVNTVLQTNPQNIVEIGPGTGSFTSLIYEKHKELILIEKDYELAQSLQLQYPDIKIYNEDFLDFNLDNLPENITFFGSLPYNVSKPIISKIIKSTKFTNNAYFIIQKEVAEKYCNKKRNQLGLIREIYADCKILNTIKPDNFTPRPNVISSYIEFTPHDKYKDIDHNKLEKLIHQSFGQPRKTLKNNLKNSEFNITSQFERLRPDQITMEEYMLILHTS